MFLFMTLPQLPEVFEAFLDGTLLSILVAPALFYFLYNPLRQENKQRKLIEQELRKSAKQLDQQAKHLQKYNERLEIKVSERTQELSFKNSQLQTLIAQLHDTQVQIVHNEKMSSLGQLVAGLAHEINNPVSFIYGNLTHVDDYTQNLMKAVRAYETHVPHPPKALQAILDMLDLEFIQEDLGKLLKSIKVGTTRIQQTVVSLRNFSRLDESEFKCVDLHEGIDNTLMILQHRLNPTPESPEIEIVKDYGILSYVECAPGQLNQVFMNLLINAIDAIEDAIQLATQDNLPARPNRISISTQVVLDNRVQIAISDSGIGIPETKLSKIFDPFFTTKPLGQGTGMGLSISYKIITEVHHGQLRCESTHGEGTTFLIEIPMHHPEVSISEKSDTP